MIHTSEPETFVPSPYARAWLIKVLLVAVVVVCAAWNRVRLVPQVMHGSQSAALRHGILLELVVISTVFIATGRLTTSALPHSGEGGSDIVRNLFNLIRYFKEKTP